MSASDEPPLAPADRAPAELRTQRRARAAVGALFLTNGAVFANLLTRYPEIKDDLGLSNAAMGTAVAAFPFGALLAGLAGGALVHRFRSSRVAVACLLVTAAAVAVAGAAPTWAALAGAMFVGGAADAVMDVAQNAHALRVQRQYGRSILNSFHAVWSVEAVLGGVMGSVAAGLRVPPPAHLVGTGVLLCLVVLGCYRYLLPGPENAERSSRLPIEEPLDPEATGRGNQGTRTSSPRSVGRPLLTTLSGALLALGVIAAGGGVVEDAGASWGAIYLSDSLGAAPAVAGLAFVSLQGMQFVGRVLGDRLVDRHGQRRVARAGALITTVGMSVALLAPTTATTLAGFGAAGLGVATLVPAAMHAADELPGLSPGTGLTVVSWLLRVGFLLFPPIIGAVADAVSLRAGLLVVPLAGLTVLALSRQLDDRPARAA